MPQKKRFHQRPIITVRKCSLLPRSYMAMIPVEKERLEFERSTEEKRFKFEKFKFYIQMAAIVVSILSTIIGAYVAFSKYSHEKQRQDNELYRKTLANLESGDSKIQKASLLELCRFHDQYDKTVPILIDFLEERKKSGDVILEETLLTTFLIIGEPMVQELAKENRNSFNKNESRFKVIQWAIVELIKKNVGNKLYNVDLYGISLEKADLKNLVISNILLKGTTINGVNFNGTNFKDINLSETTFNDCKFWQAKFEKTTNLKNVTFNKCLIKDTSFDCDLTETKFKPALSGPRHKK